jgi:hypothetical protein
VVPAKLLHVETLAVPLLRQRRKMQSVYQTWIDQPVVLQVVAGELKVPLRGTIISEAEDSVKFRVGEGWDVEIHKCMILAVEEDNWVSIVT